MSFPPAALAPLHRQALVATTAERGRNFIARGTYFAFTVTVWNFGKWVPAAGAAGTGRGPDSQGDGPAAASRQRSVAHTWSPGLAVPRRRAGAAPLTGVRLTNPLSMVGLISVDQYECSLINRVVSCAWDSIPGRESRIVTVRGNLPVNGTRWSNTATVSAPSQADVTTEYGFDLPVRGEGQGGTRTSPAP